MCIEATHLIEARSPVTWAGADDASAVRRVMSASVQASRCDLVVVLAVSNGVALRTNGRSVAEPDRDAGVLRAGDGVTE
jgi:hypothetical protein